VVRRDQPAKRVGKLVLPFERGMDRSGRPSGGTGPCPAEGAKATLPRCLLCARVIVIEISV